MEKQNLRRTLVGSALDPRFNRRVQNVLQFWLLTIGPSPFCICDPFLCKACPETITGRSW